MCIGELAGTVWIWVSRQHSVEHAPQFNQADKLEPISTMAASGRYRLVRCDSMPLEVLNGSFVFLCLCFRRERAEISSLAGFGIFPARIQPILPGFQFPDHAASTIRRWSGLCALDCRATASVAEHRQAGGAPALGFAGTLKPECEQAGENCQIRRQMRRKTPVLTGVSETTTGNI